jgi:uncharacterized membrane protein YccF (DUF307 family)
MKVTAIIYFGSLAVALWVLYVLVRICFLDTIPVANACSNQVEYSYGNGGHVG